MDIRDRIRGCLIGGAARDALFMTADTAVDQLAYANSSIVGCCFKYNGDAYGYRKTIYRNKSPFTGSK